MPVDPNVLVGFETGDDAAIYRVTDEIALVLTLDFFPPIVDDPFDYGAIAVANAVSDVYAVGGRPIAGLNIAAFPESLSHEVIARIFEGGATKAAEAGFPVLGGHTVLDDEPKYGMAVTGFVHPGKQVTNAAARVGDKLVLTKPLGTGIIATAGKAQVVNPEDLATAIKSLSAPHRDAADAMVHLMKTYSGEAHINVGTGADITIAELVELICDIVGFNGGVRYISEKPDGAPVKRLDVTRLNALGWKANTDLRDGIARTYAWYAAQSAAPVLAEDG